MCLSKCACFLHQFYMEVACCSVSKSLSPLCQCVFDCTHISIHLIQDSHNQRDIENFTLPFAINSKRRYIFGRNRSRTLQIYGAHEMHGKMAVESLFP